MTRIIFIAILIYCGSCEPRQGKSVDEAPPKASHVTGMQSKIQEIVVQEVLQANSYTYIKADENGNEIWIAILKRDVEVGNTYYYGQAMEMKNFKSKDLDRTFESIFFLEGISDSPDGNKAAGVMMPKDETHKKSPRQEMTIEHEEGEIAIEYLFENKESLEGKKVAVRGIVTKFNPDIMNRNWVHIQDGTGGEKSFDLTITTLDNIKIGSVVSFEGIVAVNKDFGHGYKYDLILEEAVHLNKKKELTIN